MATSTRVAQILSQVVHPHDGEVSLPQRLVLSCARSLPVTGVGLVLMVNGVPVGVAAATDGPAQVMEELQFTLGEGPCVDSARSGRPVLLPDLAAVGPARWPAFSEGALAVGIRAIFALPLRVGAVRLGVLDLYRDHTGVLSPTDLAEALSFADAATAILLHLQDSAASDEALPIGLLDDRAEVHQAAGFIAGVTGMDLSAAMVVLRARAYASDRPIAELAADVLSGVQPVSGDQTSIHWDLPGP